jgi:hypothetical protein
MRTEKLAWDGPYFGQFGVLANNGTTATSGTASLLISGGLAVFVGEKSKNREG